MRMLIIALRIVMSVPAATALPNEMITDLRGFQIGQYRDVAKNELGEAMKKDKYQDGFEYEIYLVNRDTSVYMIFEYSPADLAIIWSIQLTGRINYEADFKGLKLGVDQSRVIEILGSPSRKENIGKYGEKWEYDGTNYSIEINTRGKLSSVKITDASSTLFPKLDANKIPTFGYVTDILKSKSPSKVKELLCPDVEISVHDSIYFFKNSISEEIKKDHSGIFKLISNLSADLEKINTSKVDEFEGNIRVATKQDPMYVMKIKKGNGIKEIVLKYRFGKYLIWEIKA